MSTSQYWQTCQYPYCCYYRSIHTMQAKTVKYVPILTIHLIHAIYALADTEEYKWILHTNKYKYCQDVPMYIPFRVQQVNTYNNDQYWAIHTNTCYTYNTCQYILVHISMYSGAVHTNTVKYQPKPVNMYNTFHYTLLMHTNTDHFFLRLAAALLLRLFGKNPRSHHKGATGRVRTGDQRLPVLCHCQLGQDIPYIQYIPIHANTCYGCQYVMHGRLCQPPCWFDLASAENIARR